VKTAFFEFRAEKITAKIHCDNKRSIRAFLSCGFRPERETAQLKVYTLTIEQYLKRLKGETFMSSEIYITKLDRDRIKGILDKLYESSTKPDNNIKKLQGELNRAIVVEPQEVSGDVITMNSRALLQLDEQDMEVSLVYPEEADLADMKLSVFSPIGTAILGYKEGSSIKWEVPSGTSMIHIKKVIYQPEAAGDYHL
jgi:regulator of nucleoside diphosphate kinase